MDRAGETRRGPVWGAEAGTEGTLQSQPMSLPHSSQVLAYSSSKQATQWGFSSRSTYFLPNRDSLQWWQSKRSVMVAAASR